MKTLHIGLGGHHATGDDLLWLQAGIIESFKTFLDDFIGNHVILSGVEFTIGGGDISWTAGYIYMEGEICQVDAGVAVYNANNAFEIVETYDPAGEQEYEDTVTEQTYIVRKASLTGTTGGTYLFSTARRFKSWREWTAATLLGSWVASGAAPLYGRNLIGDVIFRGVVTEPAYASGTDSKICTLAAGYRPTYLITVIVPALVNTVKTFLHLQIDSNGDVMPLGLATNDVVVIYLDGVRFNPA